MAEKKVSLLRKVYTYADGETGRSAKAGWTKLTFELLAPQKDADDNLVVIDSVSITPDMFPGEIIECAIGHGFSQKLGDDLSGIAAKAAKEEPPVANHPTRGFVDYARERLEAMIDNLKNGVWVEEGEGASGASNVTLLFEAILTTFAESGSPLSDEQQATVREKLKDKTYREGAKARPDVAANLAQIVAKRAAERAAKAAEKAAAQTEAPDLSALI